MSSAAAPDIDFDPTYRACDYDGCWCWEAPGPGRRIPGSAQTPNPALHWTMHDGSEDFRTQPGKNPLNRQLADALKELKAAREAPTAGTIGGRARLQLATDRAESVKAAHRKWHKENGYGW
jgi:hypothetical protein